MRPYFLYRLGPSQEHRTEHVQWNGLILPVDDPWWNTHYPPNGWGCKCHIRQISQRERDRLAKGGRYRLSAPTIEEREWINKRTGEITRVPNGIDPGWNINPGRDRNQQLDALLSDKLNAANPADRQAAQDTFDE